MYEERGENKNLIIGLTEREGERGRERGGSNCTRSKNGKEKMEKVVYKINALNKARQESRQRQKTRIISNRLI